MDMDHEKLREFIDILGDLSISGETPEIAEYALKLQVELIGVYGTVYGEQSKTSGEKYEHRANSYRAGMDGIKL